MLSNLRSIPIEGHVTDSAGNVLRNSLITVKQETPAGSVILATTQSDDTGYFITNPLPNGIYDIYESGIKISRITHNTEIGGIQCFQADYSNYNASIIGNFSSLAASQNLNSYKAFIQLEPSYINTSQLGNLFCLYDVNITVDPQLGPGENVYELFELSKFFSLTSDSRITTNRFDVEYFLPITSTSNLYKRIKWAGVPAIRFYKDSKLVLPLDYYSIVANNTKIIIPSNTSFGTGEIICNSLSTGKGSITDTVDFGKLTTLVNRLSVGDILKIRFGTSGLYTVWYGIVTGINYDSKKEIILEKWQSSRFLSTTTDFTTNIDRIFAFDGMFSNIMSIGQEINQLFTVVENFSAQNQQNELYNYNYQ